MMMERWSLIPIIKNKYDNTFCDNGLYNNSRCDSTRGIETAVSFVGTIAVISNL